MKRLRLDFLKNWIASEQRKPLVIRGARQVGKTWIVRELAKLADKTLIEINLEKKPEQADLFSSNDPAQIIINISAALNKKIESKNCLLFLDEIQASPWLLAKLRWFSEDLPELAVIVAGSLLEFVLEKHEFSMPVGRIQYMHLEPMTFEEFLLASDKLPLLDFLKNYQLKENFPVSLHQQFLQLFKEYLLVGGLPAAVWVWTRNRNLDSVNQNHHDLLYTYRDDFAKYSGRLEVLTLDKVMNAVPSMLGQKFVYNKVSSTLHVNTVKNALDLLDRARICHRVKATAANGVPLGAEVKEKYFKQILLDTGLACAMLGLNFNQLNLSNEIILINQGAMAEQVVGQMLRTLSPPYVEPNLYYWVREEKGSNAELDYLIEHNNQIIPIEVKAGSTGSLKSLHLFMGLKKYSLALRINSDLPSKTPVAVVDQKGNHVSYELLSLPFYLIGEIYRFLQ